MGNRQRTPSTNCDLICGRGQPITTIVSLCARLLLPVGLEREGTRAEEGKGGGGQIVRKETMNKEGRKKEELKEFRERWKGFRMEW